MKKRKTLFIFLLLFSISAFPKGKNYRFQNIRIHRNQLLLDFSVHNLITNEMVTGLQKGMTTAIEYDIQLWKKRSKWIDNLIAEKRLRIKIHYDTWEKRFVFMTPNTESQTISAEEISHRCSEFTDFEMASAGDLETGSTYIIAIKIVIHPISVENIQEIKNWLKGEARELIPKAIKDNRSAGKKVGDFVMGVLLNLTGFGDKIITAKSPTFTLKDNKIIFDDRR